MKTTLEINPSFLNASYIEIKNQLLTIDVLPKHSGSNMTGKWSFDINEEYSQKIAVLTKEIIKVSKTDTRIILDGVSLKCGIQTPDTQAEYIFRCPEANTPELELVLNYLTLVNEQKLDNKLSNYLEHLEGYFMYKFPVKEFNEDPYRVRIYGSLTIDEKDELTNRINAIVSRKQRLVVDMTNLRVMGTALYSCFEPLKHISDLEILVNESALMYITEMKFETDKIKLIENI
jgi:hypothetical protein